MAWFRVGTGVHWTSKRWSGWKEVTVFKFVRGNVGIREFVMWYCSFLSSPPLLPPGGHLSRYPAYPMLQHAVYDLFLYIATSFLTAVFGHCSVQAISVS